MDGYGTLGDDHILLPQPGRRVGLGPGPGRHVSFVTFAATPPWRVS
jgi:hypothetical protein